MPASHLLEERALSPPSWVRDELGSPTGRGVRIGIIDSGWDPTVVGLHIEPGVGLVDPEDDLARRRTSDVADRIGHGTACTGLIARLAPEARLHPIRVFGRCLETSVPTLRAAILWAVEQQLEVINISLGTLREDALHPLYATCEFARRNGVILVAATHNVCAWSYPAVFENVISVGAGRLASPFDYYYRRGEAVECLARGIDQWVLQLGGQPALTSATSFAAPNITGLVALFLQRYPGASIEDMRALLERFSLDPVPTPPGN